MAAGAVRQRIRARKDFIERHIRRRTEICTRDLVCPRKLMGGNASEAILVRRVMSFATFASRRLVPNSIPAQDPVGASTIVRRIARETTCVMET